MPPSDATLRSHLEAIRDELTNPKTGNPNMLAPDAYGHAVAALAILDHAERAHTWLNGECIERLRLVPDPEPGDA